MSDLRLRFTKWEATVPADLVGDPIWRLTAFRMALFMSDIALEDVSFLVRRGAAAQRIAQLERSVESIEANIAEGYSKFSGKDRARFFEMALGSAREAREWYRRSGHMIGAPHALERRLLLTEIIKILTVVIPQERSGACQRRITKAGEKRRDRRPDKRSNHRQ